ncbi:MAG: FAD:protein FMN transferase [Candidatus Endonucleobacter sp. (ex Gigantidas childressi)]|nr:FAD:protein FMN transferase [Candidatus Endonucleobacter sp. (ex Gigantidas childressi)]
MHVALGSCKRSLLLGGLVLLGIFYVLITQPRIKQFEGKTMGTTYHVSYVGAVFFDSSDDISKKVHEVLHDVDLRMSTYREDSELMQFNRAPLTTAFKVSSDIVDLVKQSQRISAMSDGAYDVTVGPLVNLWGFGPSGHGSEEKSLGRLSEIDSIGVKAQGFDEWMLKNYPAKVPPQAAIDEVRQWVGYQYVVVDSDNSTLMRNKPVFVDLSSIAKGYGVDKVAQVLNENNIANFMIEVGGEVRVNGLKSDGSQWRLAIRGPNLTREHSPKIVTLGNKALATSGDYLNFFEVDGRRYAHTINPLTGYPEVSDLAEVAVISETAAEADALATMFMVLGEQRGLDLANREGIAAYFTYRSGNGFDSVASKSFQLYLVN